MTALYWINLESTFLYYFPFIYLVSSSNFGRFVQSCTKQRLVHGKRSIAARQTFWKCSVVIKDGHSLVNGICNVLSHDSRSDDIGLCSIFSVIVTSMMMIIQNYWLTREFNFCIKRFNKFQQKNRGIPLSLLTLCGNSFVLIHHSKQLQDRGNNRSSHHPEQFHNQHQQGCH